MFFFKPVVVVSKLTRRRFSAPKHFLIVDNAKIGDLVCVTPLFRAIKESYPGSRLTVLTTSRAVGILRNNHRIDNLIAPTSFSRFWPTTKAFWRILFLRCDIALVLVPGTVNYLLPYFCMIPVRLVSTSPAYSHFYQWLAKHTGTQSLIFPNSYLSIRYYLDFLKPLGITYLNLKKEVFYKPKDRDKVISLLVDLGWRSTQKLLAFSLSAGNQAKEWPIENFVELIIRVTTKYKLVAVLIGGPSDSVNIGRFQHLVAGRIPLLVINQLTLEELPALLSMASYFVSVDSGPLYIANALGVPVVDIAGPCDIYDQMPIYEKCEVVYLSGLTDWPHSSVLKPTMRLVGHQNRSVKGILPEMVMRAFDRLHEIHERI